jgi:hypothetical protein
MLSQARTFFATDDLSIEFRPRIGSNLEPPSCTFVQIKKILFISLARFISLVETDFILLKGGSQ